jgi:hypothetical protein
MTMLVIAHARVNLSPCGQMWVGQPNVDRADAENGENYRLCLIVRYAATVEGPCGSLDITA